MFGVVLVYADLIVPVYGSCWQTRPVELLRAGCLQNQSIGTNNGLFK
jgi:hypothetical protein